MNTALHTDAETHDLFVTGHPSNVSLLKPNLPLINTLAYPDRDFAVIKTVPVKCERLDEVSSREGLQIDVLKVDTQGTELYILQGDANCLNDSVFAIELEVEFIELYEHQPLFTDVDQYLRIPGFGLMDYGNLLYVKSKHAIGIGGHKAHLVSADALYFKQLDRIADITADKNIAGLKRAIAVFLAYGYSDYAIEVCHQVKNLGLISSGEADALIARLERANHHSRYFPNVPGKKTLAKLLKASASLLTQAHHAHWGRDLATTSDYTDGKLDILSTHRRRQ